ncbi:unnamed protein product [Callosobruchus maculatus]|uniref:Uncharacterized protein n=1 Tax=Callosobruchus maculatus TaxID=64391 RepID=A0A653BSW8_CALMS|nr:unnamed protein product [Callosobruchus maculatus]
MLTYKMLNLIDVKNSLNLSRIFATCSWSSLDSILKFMSSPLQLEVQKGPLILRTTAPLGFLITNSGYTMLHSCSTEPIKLPGGDEASILCRQHGQQHQSQAIGLCKRITSCLEVSKVLISNSLRYPRQFLGNQWLYSSA